MTDRIPVNPPVILPVAPVKRERPLWSVMIPAYNCIGFLESAIQSVLAQDQGRSLMQIEVVDDCSTDGDVQALVHAIGKGRVSYYRQEHNRGSLRNFETCLNRAQGQWVHLLHGDDQVEHGYYEEITRLFTVYPEAGAAFTNFYFIDAQSSKLDIVNPLLSDKPGIIPGFLFKIAARQLIQPPAIVVKRSVYETIGGFYAVEFGEDWEMWARIAAGFPVVYSPRFLASYRVGHHAGISYRSFITGTNIKDISQVVEIIQHHLPAEKRKAIKKDALAYYAIYCIKLANYLLLSNKQAAFTQVRGALKMNRSPSVLFWATRFYLMYVSGFKEIQQLFTNYSGWQKKVQSNNQVNT